MSTAAGGVDVQSVYERRFGDTLAFRRQMWDVLCRRFFQQYVPTEATVVEIGAGYCEFINNIRAGKKIAVDLNPDVRRFAAADVRVINESCTAIRELDSNSADVVFMSNFLEHLPNKDLVLDTFRESQRILRPGGRVMVLQPNIRYLPGEYWDYFDHHTPLTERSLVEGLQLAGLDPTTVIAKFLPYTTKSRLPQAPWLVQLYLKIPLAWHVLGKQALVVAEKRSKA